MAYRNGPRLYTWLVRASAATLREVAANPRHLGAEIGALSILHTWGQTLVRHPHVHCVVPGGGLSPDQQRWIHPTYAGFFLPVKVLSRVFRRKFVEALRRAYNRSELDLAGGSEHLRDRAAWRAFVDALFETDWVVYAKPAFGGATAVLRYLGRYTHRVAISNHRLLAFDGDHVTFAYKDYAHGDQRRTMTLTAMEFLRRFVQHILRAVLGGSVSQDSSRTPTAPPPLARRRPLHPHRSALGDPDSSPIAGRRASGFRQVSLSKVPRHRHPGRRHPLAPRHFR